MKMREGLVILGVLLVGVGLYSGEKAIHADLTTQANVIDVVVPAVASPIFLLVGVVALVAALVCDWTRSASRNE
jgi:hypothetical protein